MLKITKGLNVGGIMTYTDDDGNQYVRVKMDGEDFCIAARDCFSDKAGMFTWNYIKVYLKTEGLTTFTKKQMSIYKDKDNQIEIDNKLEEIGGDELKDDWYWTSTEYDSGSMWIFNGNHTTKNSLVSENQNRNYTRPVLNLSNK